MVIRVIKMVIMKKMAINDKISYLSLSKIVNDYHIFIWYWYIKLNLRNIEPFSFKWKITLKLNNLLNALFSDKIITTFFVKNFELMEDDKTNQKCKEKGKMDEIFDLFKLMYFYIICAMFLNVIFLPVMFTINLGATNAETEIRPPFPLLLFFGKISHRTKEEKNGCLISNDANILAVNITRNNFSRNSLLNNYQCYTLNIIIFNITWVSQHNLYMILLAIFSFSVVFITLTIFFSRFISCENKIKKVYIILF